MTRKDYELIAKPFYVQITRLHEARNRDGDTTVDKAIEEITILADKLANTLKEDNRAFDYDKFMNAAGVLNNPFDPSSSAYIG